MASRAAAASTLRRDGVAGDQDGIRGERGRDTDRRGRTVLRRADEGRGLLAVARRPDRLDAHGPRPAVVREGRQRGSGPRRSGRPARPTAMNPRATAALISRVRVARSRARRPRSPGRGGQAPPTPTGRPRGPPRPQRPRRWRPTPLRGISADRDEVLEPVVGLGADELSGPEVVDRREGLFLA